MCHKNSSVTCVTRLCLCMGVFVYPWLSVVTNRWPFGGSGRMNVSTWVVTLCFFNRFYEPTFPVFADATNGASTLAALRCLRQRKLVSFHRCSVSVVGCNIGNYFWFIGFAITRYRGILKKIGNSKRTFLQNRFIECWEAQAFFSVLSKKISWRSDKPRASRRFRFSLNAVISSTETLSFHSSFASLEVGGSPGTGRPPRSSPLSWQTSTRTDTTAPALPFMKQRSICRWDRSTGVRPFILW